jgi:cytochrome c oxidase cbb3-type subunit 3
MSGYPNLRDDEWLWGGKPDDILSTLRFGIRSPHRQTRASQMPRFGLDNMLNDRQIDDVAEYALSLTKKGTDAAAASRGAPIFKEQCVSCHGDDGKGKIDQGAPSLVDNIWLYGSAKADVVVSIRTGRGGMMPAWEGRLDPVTIKALSVYVHRLGGGQ